MKNSKIALCISAGFASALTLGALAMGYGGGAGGSPRPQPPRIREACGDLRSLPFGRYCIARQERSRNPDVLYYFHGLNDDENFWLKELGLPLYARWRERGVDAPTVVSISVHNYRLGNFWLLVDKNDQSTESGYLSRTVLGAIPEVEKILGGVRGKRLLMGASMGGFNAAQLYIHYGHLFSRVALVCPAITTVSPFAPDAEFAAYRERTGASWYNVEGSVHLVKRVLPTEALYQQQAPLNQARKKLNSKSAPLHVSCGSDDEYGFQEGSRVLADVARANGVSVTFQLLPPGTRHGVPHGASVADFLIP